jgi:hypothetical protein
MATGKMGMSSDRQMRMSPDKMNMSGGHLYMQTNETRNCIIHYRHRYCSGSGGIRSPDPSEPPVIDAANCTDPRRTARSSGGSRRG